MRDVIQEKDFPGGSLNLTEHCLAKNEKYNPQGAGTYELNGRTSTNSSYVQYMLTLSETESQVSRQRPKFPQGLVAWPWLVHVRRQKPWESSIYKT